MTVTQQTHTNPILFSDRDRPRDPHGFRTLAVKDWRSMIEGCAPFLAQATENCGCDAPDIQAWLIELPNGGDAWFAAEEAANSFIAEYGALLRATSTLLKECTYARAITAPKSKRDGLVNFVQMIINLFEDGNAREALLTAVDLRQDLMCSSNPYREIAGD